MSNLDEVQGLDEEVEVKVDTLSTLDTPDVPDREFTLISTETQETDEVDEKTGQKKTKDVPGERLTTNLLPLLRSELVRTCVTDDKEETELQVKAKIGPIREIVTYVNHYVGSDPPKIQRPIKSKKMVENTDEWSAAFIDRIQEKDLDDLYDLILAANYMGVTSLVELGCAKLAAMIKNEPLDKIRGILEPPSRRNLSEVFSTMPEEKTE